MLYSVVLYCCWMTTDPLTRLCVFNRFLKEKVFSLKKIGKFVQPAPGFQIFATANTKGKGSDDGRFIGTNVLNEAFLERFPVTFEQEYPTPQIEQKILGKLCDDEIFCKRLCD